MLHIPQSDIRKLEIEPDPLATGSTRVVHEAILDGDLYVLKLPFKIKDVNYGDKPIPLEGDSETTQKLLAQGIIASSQKIKTSLLNAIPPPILKNTYWAGEKGILMPKYIATLYSIIDANQHEHTLETEVNSLINPINEALGDILLAVIDKDKRGVRLSHTIEGYDNWGVSFKKNKASVRLLDYPDPIPQILLPAVNEISEILREIEAEINTKTNLIKSLSQIIM